MAKSLKTKLLFLLAGALICANAQAEVLSQSENGFVLENQIETKSPPMQAWLALINDVRQWWPADHSWFGKAENFSIEAKAGGCFCEINGDQQVQHMYVVHSNPGRLLRMMGGLGPLQGMGLSGPLDWIFEAIDGGGTRIRLRYHVSGYSPQPLGDFINVVDKVQAVQLGSLGTYLNKP